MIIDDDLRTIDTLKRLSGRHRYQIFSARSAAESLEVFALQELQLSFQTDIAI